jgi:histidinol-phosphate/aromatic aminotransferase/cobyric acid decarboxylase-like protein
MKIKKPIRLYWGENYSEKPLIVKKAIDKSFQETNNRINLYPGNLYEEAQIIVTKPLGLKKENVIFGHGIEGLIHLTTETFLTKGKVGGMFEPSFFVFNNNLKRGKHIKFDCHYSKLVDFTDLKKRINNTNLFFLASPNTATGNYLLNKNQIEEILKIYKGILVVDECYFGIGNMTVIDLINKYNNLIVYRGMTKVMGLGSLRLGFAFSNSKLIEKLNYNFRKIELDPIGAFSLNTLIYAYPYYNKLAINTNKFFAEFFDYIRLQFPKDRFIKNVTTFHFMDLTRYKVKTYEVINYMNSKGYEFSSETLTSNESLHFPEFLELTPPPKEYWNDFAVHLNEILK